MNPACPKISLIIPNFNRGDLLTETLDSVLQQDYTGWEALVIDDGSTDNSSDVGQSYAKSDPRIHFFSRDREPRGAPVCRNIGAERSSGEYLIFLDSDDLLMPGALTQRIRTIGEFPEYDFWVFPMLMFRNDPSGAKFLWNIDNGVPDLHRFLVLDAPWQTSGPVWRRDAVVRIGGFTEGLACWQDVDFHLKALIGGLKGRKFYNLPPDTLYRQHEVQSISQGEISSPAKLKSRFEIFRSHAGALMNRFNGPPVNATDAFSHNQSISDRRGIDAAVTVQSDAPGFSIHEDLRLLGGNIALGAARALNREVFGQVIRFGAGHRIFPPAMVSRLKAIMYLYLFRLNRIRFIHERIQSFTKLYRQDSNIGKHPLKPPQA